MTSFNRVNSLNDFPYQSLEINEIFPYIVNNHINKYSVSQCVHTEIRTLERLVM